MTPPKRSAEQQIGDEADRKAKNPIGSRQTIAESHADPEFQENHNASERSGWPEITSSSPTLSRIGKATELLPEPW
jgi:hypothetical protein